MNNTLYIVLAIILIMLILLLMVLIISSSDKVVDIIPQKCPDYWTYNPGTGCQLNSTKGAYSNSGLCINHSNINYCSGLADAVVTCSTQNTTAHYAPNTTCISIPQSTPSNISNAKLTENELKLGTCTLFNWAKKNKIQWNGLTNISKYNILCGKS